MTAAAMDINTNGPAEVRTDMANGTSAPENIVFSSFMQGFWDLSSVDVPTRTSAAATIVRYVTTGGDAEYALKRLVRGVCSSRAAARQGFASCLTEVLNVLPNDASTTPQLLEQLLETTQFTSAMKGAEERERAIGRLLGLSALARSGRLKSEPGCAEEALKALIELYRKRKWLSQAAGEAALLVASEGFSSKAEVKDKVVPLFVPLLKAQDGSVLQLSDLSPHQLMVALGLHAILRAKGLEPQKDPALKEILPSFLQHPSVVRIGKAEDLVQPLKLSAEAFPKVHSVWGRLWDDMGLAAAGQPRGSLSAKHLRKLGEVWAAVVDGTLAISSHNNKGTALIVLKQVLQRVPAAGVWAVLSPGVTRLMLNQTQDKNNYLFSLVRMTLEQLPELVQDDPEVQAQVVACLLRRGSGQFDKRANVPVVSSLVENMGQEAMEAHVELLKGVVLGKRCWEGSQGASGKPVGEATGTATGDAEDLPEEVEAATTGFRLQAIESLHQLTRKPMVGSGAEGSSTEGTKKLKHAAGEHIDEDQCQRVTQVALLFQEVAFFEPIEGAGPLPKAVQHLCTSKFFSLVGDMVNKPLFWAGDKHPDGARWGALEALWGLHEAWQGFEANGRKLAAGLSVDADEREALASAMAVVRKTREIGGADKLRSAFAAILLVACLRLLDPTKASERSGERCQYIMDILETYGRMSRDAGDEDGAGGDGDDGDSDDEPDPLAVLADVLVAVMSEPSNHSIKDLRDVSRRVWSLVCASRPPTSSAFETLLAVVCGDDEDKHAEDGEENDDDGDEDEDEHKDDGEGKGKGGVQGGNMMGRRKAGRKGRKHEEDVDGMEEGEDEAGDDEEEEDEVIMDPSYLERLLTEHEPQDGDGDGDDSEKESDEAEAGQALEHDEGADRALGALINLKKANRKKNMLEEERQGIQIRLRALGLLEVLCGRHPHSEFLLDALVPVLKATNKLGRATAPGGLRGGEAQALEQRLENLFKSRLCKCKARVEIVKEEAGAAAIVGTGEGGEAPAPREQLPARLARIFEEMMGICRTMKENKMRSLALVGSTSCLKSLKGLASKQGGGLEENKGAGARDALEKAIVTLRATVGEAFETRRTGGLNAWEVEDMVKVFPEELSPVLMKAIMGSAASDYLRAMALHHWGGVLKRRAQLEPRVRKMIVEDCPSVLEDLKHMLEVAVKTKQPGEAEDEKDKNSTPREKTKGQSSTEPTLVTMRSKRLKPLLNCLLLIVQAMKEAGKSGPLRAHFKEICASLKSIKSSCPSAPIKGLCDQVALELGAVDGVEKGQTVLGEVAPSNESSQGTPRVGRGEGKPGAIKENMKDGEEAGEHKGDPKAGKRGSSKKRKRGKSARPGEVKAAEERSGQESGVAETATDKDALPNGDVGAGALAGDIDEVDKSSAKGDDGRRTKRQGGDAEGSGDTPAKGQVSVDTTKGRNTEGKVGRSKRSKSKRRKTVGI